jgi:hypothetical protein
VSATQHLSMRVPWRDRPWDGFVCDNPLGNSSCVLHAGIGPRRDDGYEAENAAAAIDTLDQNRLPCLSERATFMSPLGYTVVKQHPYRHNEALKDMLLDTPLTMPGFAFEALPFRWLNRESLAEDIGHDRVHGFVQDAEDRADAALGFAPNWLMDGDNQRAAIDAFFEPVQTGDSLVFMYVKHSPLQEQRTDRLLVGVARVTRVTPPLMWNQAGKPPFKSSMWETVVEHSLRPEMTDGVLLPYQRLVELMDQGEDIDPALAWAPEGRQVEFSYVTEHLSDDAAIESLAALQSAVDGMRMLGIEVPDPAVAWLKEQTERLWEVRGPAPGLPGVLKQMGVQRPYVATRIIQSADPDGDPWKFLDFVLASPTTAPQAIRPHVGLPQAKIWKKLGVDMQDVLRLLSGLDVTPDQIDDLLNGRTEIELEPEQLLENPYYAATCTYGSPDHIPFKTIDQALFPPSYVTWSPPVPAGVELQGHLDRRRIEALFTDVLERRGVRGDTIVPIGEVLALANEVDLTQPPNLTALMLPGLDLDYESLQDWDGWSPLTIRLADGTPAYKLERFDYTSDVIRKWIEAQLNRQALGPIKAARDVLNAALDRNVDVTGDVDELEDRARTEKAAGLSMLHSAPLSVLIGPAGTGKTTLLRALVEYPGVADGGVLLLAPTGKARVQLETKVGRRAQTLASYLSTTDRYDGETGRYVVRDDKPRRNCGLVVIDEASMLTEEMLAAMLDSFAAVRRLILVGDPRQLPPIGPGRPFVDLVNKLSPGIFLDWVRVGEGYVELQVPRRQLADGTHGVRHDLDLAAWFGDVTRGAADDSIWTELADTPDLPTVRYEPWGERTASEAVADTLAEILPLDGDPEPARAFALTYGGVMNGKYLNWELGAGSRAEDWQILSPTRSRGFGTVELNRQIKRTYRTGDTAWAQKNTWKGNIPRPIGPELIVRGDKVMQTQNKRLSAWPKDDAMNYVGNGEIGVAIGRVIPASRTPKRNLPLRVEFSSQPGFHYSYWTSQTDDPLLELAWAVTVHKSQGSEFAVTVLVLPARANVSREMMYTALTRQRNKVVILHEGDLDELRELSQPWRSETARRLTDLFALPEPIDIEIHGKARRYDRKLLHVAVGNIPVASKNEVIIAGLLDRLVPGAWLYEEPFAGSDGRVVLPDFTIAAPDGRTVYWEHAGMLDLPSYARKWDLKRAWYGENGVLPHDEGGGDRGTLMWTDDLKGADAAAWLAYAQVVLDVSAADITGVTARRGPGRGPK